MSAPEFENEIGSGPAVPVALPSSTGQVADSNRGEYLGITVEETSGSAAAKVVIYDNYDAASGAILEAISIPSGGAVSFNYERPGRQVLNGLYAVITGAVQGSVFQ